MGARERLPERPTRSNPEKALYAWVLKHQTLPNDRGKKKKQKQNLSYQNDIFIFSQKRNINPSAEFFMKFLLNSSEPNSNLLQKVAKCILKKKKATDFNTCKSNIISFQPKTYFPSLLTLVLN